MAESAAVASGDLATATQYNNLRNDVISLTLGHRHDATNGRVHLDNDFRIRNPADTFAYVFRTSAIVANRDITLPLITANDTLAVLGLAQTFTAAKTFSAAMNANSGGTLDGTFTAGSATLKFDFTGQDFWFAFSGAFLALNANNAVSSETARFRSNNPTRAANDEIYLSFALASSTGVQRDFARISVVATTVTNTAEIGAIDVSLMDGGTRQAFFRFQRGNMRFDRGAAITAGDYAVGRDSDATNQLHFNVPTGATFEFSINDEAQVLGILGGWRFPVGKAVTPAQYEIVRDADTTNQLHFNVPTGAGYEWSINDESIMTMAGYRIFLDATPAAGTAMGFQVTNRAASGASIARIYLQVDGGSTGDPYIEFARGAINVTLGTDNSDAMNFKISDSTTLGTADRLRLARATGILDVSGNSGLAAATVGKFDDFDDALILRDFIHAAVERYSLGKEARLQAASPLTWPAMRQKMAEMGVIVLKNQKSDPDDPDGYFYRVQNVFHLLAGGIYQTRERLDSQTRALEERCQALEQRIRMLAGGAQPG